MTDLISEKGLPANIDAERAVLGSLLLDHQAHADALTLISPDDFSIEKHRRIFGAMLATDGAGGHIERLTLMSYLRDRGQLESVDGFSYLIELDEGLPQFPSIERYVEIVKEKAALRRIIIAAQDLQNRCLVAGENSAEIIAGAERALSEIGYRPDTATAELLNPGEVVERAGGLQKFLNPQQLAGVKTPWPRLTEMTCGYRRGELVVLAGNPSMGKSAAMLQVAMGIADSGRGALIVSLEMSRESLIRRMACLRARVDGERFRGGYLSQEERLRLARVVAEISKWPLWIAEHGISTVAGIRSALRKKRSQHDVFMVGIDYLQLMKAVGRFQNRNAEVSEITRALKLLAVDEDVNVHLLSQLSRDNMREKRPPALHDLRDSGSIEQDADAVAFVWRPEMLHRDRDDLRGMAELILAKQRNGPVGKIELIWLAGFTKFESRAEDRDEREPESRQPALAGMESDA
jgi:replicative DNA helicase